MSEARLGYGTIIALENEDSPAEFETLAEVFNITPPPHTRETVDVTHTESPNEWREFIPQLKNGGDVVVEMNYIAGSATDQKIRETFAQKRKRRWRITVPTSPEETITFYGITTNYSGAMPVDDKTTKSLTIKITGEPVYGSDGSP